MRRHTVRHWTVEERSAAEKALDELLATGTFGATESEVWQTFNVRWNEIAPLPEEAGRVAWSAFMAEIDRAVPGASTILFPVSAEAARLASEPIGWLQ